MKKAILKRKKKVLITSVIAIIILILVLVTISRVNSTNHGTLSSSYTIKSNQSTFVSKPVQYSDKFISFNYPSSLVTGSTSTLVFPSVDKVNFTYRDVVTWSLAIEVLNIPNGQLNSNSGYQVRKINPTKYQQSNLDLNNNSGVVMTDKSVGEYSKVVFLVHGPYQASISLTGDDLNGNTNLDKTLNMIVSSWQWRSG